MIAVARQPGKRPPKAAPKKPARPAKKVVRPPARRAPVVVPVVTARTKAPDLIAALDSLRASRDPNATAQSKREWAKWLRRICGLLFIADDMERSVVGWHREIADDLIGVDQFQRWATADGWLKAREERLVKFREAVERQIGTDNVRTFVRDLEKLDELHEDVAGKLAGRGNKLEVEYVNDEGKLCKRFVEVVPTTFEKRSEAVKALVELDRRRDEKRKGVLGGLPTALGTGAGPREFTVTTTLTLSPGVARAMARAKLVAERDEIEGNGEAAGEDGDE